ncbi:MAG: hypothetical protein KFF73_13765 [Cyclobacteriaceae bacterium]|nr:hypothetical protein [Cyclobacteriaceae bacterium]
MMSLKNYFVKIQLVCFLFPVMQCTAQPGTIQGIYGSPEPFWERNYKLSDLGVNAVFVHSGSIDQAMVNKVKTDGLKIYAEFATLNGKNYVEKNPDAWPIDENGQKAEQASWFMGVCPTNAGFRQYRMNQLKELLQSYDVDGVWMDYVHWHAQFEEPEPILPETCFCNSCLTSFEKSAGIRVPGNNIPEKAGWILKNKDPEWRNWRCSVIRSWAMEMKEILRDKKPGSLLGIYHCPWDDDEFNGARRRILGLDYDMLRDVVDVFSPMVYHGRMGREPEWVMKNTEWICNRLNIRRGSNPEVWPIVQAYNDPYPISPEEFERVLKGGLAAESAGVMMFTSYAVAEDQEKIRIMQKVYQSNDE